MTLATTPLSALLPLVRAEVPFCPQPLMEQNLRLSAIEFCERTGIWREELTLTVDAQNKAIEVPAYAALHKIETAEFDDGGGYYPLDPVRVALTGVEDRVEEDLGPPWGITQIAHNSVTLIPYAAGTLKMLAILKPIALPKFGVSGETTEQAIQNVIPTLIAEQWGHIIGYGAVARIATMPNQPFTNGDLAAVRYQQFNAETSKLSDEGQRGQHRARPRTRSRFV